MTEPISNRHRRLGCRIRRSLGCLFFCLSPCAFAANITVDVSGVLPGPIAVGQNDQSLTVSWRDAPANRWQAIFSLNPAEPLITAIAANGNNIVTRARPIYRCSTGKRSGGWDAFFDFPPANPAGTRRFLAEFHPTKLTARSVGNRVEV